MRSLFAPSLSVGTVVVTDEEARHGRTVLRLRDGDELRLIDGAGRAAVAAVTAVDRAALPVMWQRLRPSGRSVASRHLGGCATKGVALGRHGSNGHRIGHWCYSPSCHRTRCCRAEARPSSAGRTRSSQAVSTCRSAGHRAQCRHIRHAGVARSGHCNGSGWGLLAVDKRRPAADHRGRTLKGDSLIRNAKVCSAVEPLRSVFHRTFYA